MTPRTFAFAAIVVLLLTVALLWSLWRSAPGTTTVYHDGQEWRWKSVARNGRITAASTEGFEHRAYAYSRARQDGTRGYRVRFDQ